LLCRLGIAVTRGQLAMFTSHGYVLCGQSRPRVIFYESVRASLAVVVKMPKLKSRKREMFAIEVASMTPLDRAYVLAGYSDTPWARYNASKLAHVPEVAARIDELLAEFSARSGIHAEYIQRKLLPIVEANAADLFEARIDAAGHAAGHQLKAIPDLPRSLAAAISKIKCDPETGAVTEVSLYSKNEAGSTLLRSVGALKEGHVTAILAVLQKKLTELNDSELQAVESRLAILGVSQDLGG
jgi:hypothetical protein